MIRFILRRILPGLILLFGLMQLIPKPEKNAGVGVAPQDISRVHNVPEPVMQILRTSCYDCHSHSTVYPWYARIQPVALWLDNHIREGREELDFSNFGAYPQRRKLKKLEEIKEVIQEGEMPLSSYTLIHRKASLNASQRQLISDWAVTLQQSLGGGAQVGSDQ